LIHSHIELSDGIERLREDPETFISTVSSGFVQRKPWPKKYGFLTAPTRKMAKHWTQPWPKLDHWKPYTVIVLVYSGIFGA